MIHLGFTTSRMVGSNNNDVRKGVENKERINRMVTGKYDLNLITSSYNHLFKFVVCFIKN